MADRIEFKNSLSGRQQQQQQQVPESKDRNPLNRPIIPNNRDNSFISEL